MTAMKKPQVFYGYWILASCFLFCLVANGCGFAVFSFFLMPLETSMGWNRAELMAGFTIFALSLAIMAPFVGRLVERYGARAVITLGALLTGSGFVLLSQMASLWQYYLGYMIIGAGSAAASQVTSSYVVSQWFKQRRGLALGIMGMGLSFSGIIYPPLFGAYILPHLGWSNTYLVLAANMVVVIIPLSLFVIRTSPGDMGLLPDGKSAALKVDIGSTLSASEPMGLSLKMAIATSAFWLLAASFFFNHQHMGVIMSQVPHLVGISFSVGIVASSFSLFAAMQILGVLFFGWLCDRIHVKYATIIGNFLIALSILVFLNIRAGSPTLLIWLYAIIMGFGSGSWFPTLSMLTSTTFGLRHYASIFGMLSLFQTLGAASGPLLAGYIYDVTGAYHLAFAIILGMVLLSIPLVIAVRRPTPETQ